MTGDECEELRIQVRKDVIDAGTRYANAWEEIDNAYVTGYILVLEIQTPTHKAPYVQWITGNGSPPNQEGEDTAGMAEHRVEGMLRSALRTVLSDEASTDLERHR